MRTATVLVIDDNPADRELTRRAFRSINPDIDVRLAVDGIDGLDYLQQHGARGPMPDVVLLDRHMPRLDGIELLIAVRADPLLHSLPIVMLTGSDDESDIQRCYAMGANTYMLKPVRRGSLIETLSAFSQYWLNQDVAVLPPPLPTKG
jgi:CheY-like chemotaxis protein